MEIKKIMRYKINIIKRMRLIPVIAALAFSAVAVAQSPTSLQPPFEGNTDNYILDIPDKLSEKTSREVNANILKLRKETSVEMAVAIVDNLDGLTPNEYAYLLFRHWGVGKSDKNNGVLLLISEKDRKVFIQVGSGAEGVLTDVACANIVRQYVSPPLRDGYYNQAVDAAVEQIRLAMSDPAVAAELQSAEPDNPRGMVKAISKDVWVNFIVLIVAFVFLFTLGLFVMDLIVTRRRDNYRRAMTWRNHMPTYLWGLLFSGGTALPIVIAAYILYRYARDVTEICDTCGAKMKKLNEEEDNAFLTPSQDFEEKIGSVDYDVWLCPECGTVERFPYMEKQLKYKQCRECHTIAENLVCDKVVVPPTTTREGVGERIYQCQYCRNLRRERYALPKTVDGAAVAAGIAAASIFSGRGGGGFGGNSGGGSFGGGTTSGGGAGGSF